MQSTIRIPFEVIISDDIRFYGPSGDYLTYENDTNNPFIRMINSEIDKTLNAAKSICEKERIKPIAAKKVNG